MKNYVLMILSLCILMSGISLAQDSSELIIVGYPLGVGGSVGDAFYAPYKAELKLRADILCANPEAIAYLTGGADKNRYRKNNDAKNPGLALGRANDLKRYLVETFSVDSTQLIVQTDEPAGKGKQYRYSSIRIVFPEITEPTKDTIYVEPQIEIREHYHNYYLDNFGLNMRAGVTSSPYGLIPIVSGAVVYKDNLHIEGRFGHTLWQDSRHIKDMKFNVWNRIAGGQLIYYFIDQSDPRLKVGLTAGWFRIEEISKDYYGYTRMSEGLTLGATANIFGWLNLGGSYFPHKERSAEKLLADTHNDSFLISLTVNKYFGGDK